MDVEPAIEHLLELHAKAELRADKAEARIDRMEKQVRVTANLVRTGVKVVFRINDRLRQVIQSQRRTEQMLQRWMKLQMRRGGGNGRLPSS